MTYKNRAKTRKFKKQLTWAFEIIKFKWINLSFSKKIILFWSLISLISLFVPWVNSTSQNITWSSFSNLSWKSWYIIILLLFFITFMVFSIQKKEKMKLNSNFHIKDYIIYLISWIIIILLSYISLNFVNWLQALSGDIIYGKWIVLSLIWWIIILVWWFLSKREENKSNGSIFLNDVIGEESAEIDNNTEDNMKLPF